MAVRLPALRAGHALSTERSLILISARDGVESRATVWLEELGQNKIQ
jgi:hypothetical protein